MQRGRVWDVTQVQRIQLRESDTIRGQDVVGMDMRGPISASKKNWNPTSRECSQLSPCQLLRASLRCREPAPPNSWPFCGSLCTVTESGGDIKILSLQQGMRHPNRRCIPQSLPTILTEALSVLHCNQVFCFDFFSLCPIQFLPFTGIDSQERTCTLDSISGSAAGGYDLWHYSRVGKAVS